MKKLLLFVFLPALFSIISSAVNAQEAVKAEPAYQIIESRTGKSISTDELINNLRRVDVLVFGEEHNDSTGHLLEAEILGKMIRTYPSTALSLEMFSTDVQPVINEYLLALISEKNFIKEAKAWNNYKDYKPLIELAKSAHTDVIAANAATRYSNAVTMAGLDKLKDFPGPSKSFLPPLPVDTATGRYHEKFIQTLGGHDMGGMKIYQTQNLWDAAMAWSVAKYAKAYPGRKIFQINGRFHSDERLGLIAQLKKYAPRLSVSSISCFSADSADAKDAAKFAGLADYVIITSSGKAN
jgi:uncharacterized iron-regulated protein